MKLLVASPRDGVETIEPCIDGEIVWIPDPCAESVRDPDGPCSCAVTFRGLATDGMTTVARVADFPDLSPAEFRQMFWHAQDQHEECTCCLREEMVDELIAGASRLAVGTLVRHRVGRLITREAPASA